MHTRKISVLFLIFISLTLSAYAQRYTISGYITDQSNGETLLNASVFDDVSRKGAVSNNYGHYSITLNAGDVSLNYSYVGYSPQFREFKLTKDTVIHVKLEASITLREVTVTGRRSEVGVHSTQMSAIEVPIEQIKNI